MSLRRSAALVLVAALAFAPVLIAAPASAVSPAPFVGVSSGSLTYADGALGAITVGVAYNDSVSRAAGFDEWSLLGTLPTGLTGTPSGDQYLISGTPTVPGDFVISLSSTNDGGGSDSVVFYMTVVGAPSVALRPIIEVLPGPYAPGDTMEVWFEYQNDSTTDDAVNPRIDITLPDGVTNLGGMEQGAWWCSGTQTVSCTMVGGVIEPSQSGVAYIATLQLSASYAKSTVTIPNMASARNAPAAITSTTLSVNLPAPVMEPPTASPYANVTLRAYAPLGRTSGTMHFYLVGDSASDEVTASVGSDGVATYTGAISSALSGSYVAVTAGFESTASVFEGYSAAQHFYVYKQLNMAGSFYLNGVAYTGGVTLLVNSATSFDGSTGAALTYAGLSGGSYNVTPTADVSHSYTARAQLTDLGNLQTYYNAAGTYQPSQGGETVIGTRNFTSAMNFYWELAPDFTDESIVVPRQNVAYADGVVATSNVTVDYTLDGGALPSGLTLNADGTITGTATTLGQAYSFTVRATNSTNSAYSNSATISGTVLPEHIVPSWVDPTIGDFRLGLAVSEGVAADGDPTIAYEVSDGDLPTGITLNPASGELSGTPTVLGEVYSFELHAYNDWGDVYASYNGEVLPLMTATTTTISTDSYSPYTGVNLTATVSENATGTVNFFLNSTLVGTSTLSGGSASYTGAVPASFVGSSPVVTAVYQGDASREASTSPSDSTVYVYGDRIISGTIMRNGVPQVGEQVALLTSTYAYAGVTDITDASGVFQFDLGTPGSLDGAKAGYAMEATGLGVYYSTTWVLGGPNVSFVGNATVVYEADWDSSFTIYADSPPFWDDQTLAQPRLGSAYSDSVSATTYAGALTYTVSGDVPAWLSFSAGAFTATNPTDQDPHTFTVTVGNGYRQNFATFTLTAQDAFVAPSFTDDTVAQLQAGVLLDDELVASGTGPITYSVTAGTLPAGLTLSSSGLIGGTPPLSAAGAAYSFTVTATGYGTDSAVISGVIAEAPTVELIPNFVVGDVAAGSTFDFEVVGAGDTVPYSATINSVPFVAASGFTSTLGLASGTGTIQTAIDAGAHSIVLLTYAADGTPRSTTIWFTVLADGTIGAISLTGPLSVPAPVTAAALGNTGLDLTPSLALAALMLAAGLVIRRRRLQQA